MAGGPGRRAGGGREGGREAEAPRRERRPAPGSPPRAAPARDPTPPGAGPSPSPSMAVDGATITSRIRNLLRSPSIKLRRSKAGARREDLGSKVSASPCPCASGN